MYSCNYNPGGSYSCRQLGCACMNIYSPGESEDASDPITITSLNSDASLLINIFVYVTRRCLGQYQYCVTGLLVQQYPHLYSMLVLLRGSLRVFISITQGPLGSLTSSLLSLCD